MKASTTSILVLGAVGLGALYLFKDKLLGTAADTAAAQFGGSLAQQAQDATFGRVFGAPSRAGSTGTSGLVGDFQATGLGAFNSLTGGAFINDVVRTPQTSTIPVSRGNAITPGVPSYVKGGGIVNPLPSTLLNTGLPNPFTSQSKVIQGVGGSMAKSQSNYIVVGGTRRAV